MASSDVRDHATHMHLWKTNQVTLLRFTAHVVYIIFSAVHETHSLSVLIECNIKCARDYYPRGERLVRAHYTILYTNYMLYVYACTCCLFY